MTLQVDVASYLLTFGCLAASNWPRGHPCIDHHVSCCLPTPMSLATSVCLAASIWPLGHLRSDRHVSNLRRPDCKSRDEC